MKKTRERAVQRTDEEKFVRDVLRGKDAAAKKQLDKLIQIRAAQKIAKTLGV